MKHPITKAQLRRFLEVNSIDTSTWGQGKNKRLDDLWQEIQDGETILEENPLRRITTFVQIIIRQQGNILIEHNQKLASGTIRGRNRPPSEKMQPGETVRSAALRGLKQELSLSPYQITLLPTAYKPKTIEGFSASYPGLHTHYTVHTVEAAIPDLPLRDFSTTEDSPTDPVRKHYWTWLPEDEARLLF